MATIYFKSGEKHYKDTFTDLSFILSSKEEADKVFKEYLLESSDYKEYTEMIYHEQKCQVKYCYYSKHLDDKKFFKDYNFKKILEDQIKLGYVSLGNKGWTYIEIKNINNNIDIKKISLKERSHFTQL